MQRRMIYPLMAALVILAITSIAASAQVSFGVGVGGRDGSFFLGVGPGYYGSPYYGGYGYPGYYPGPYPGYYPGYYSYPGYYPRVYRSYPGWGYSPHWRSWHRR